MAKGKQSTVGFKDKYAHLQKLVAWFESEDFDLDEGIKKLADGLQTVKELKQYLASVENKITELTSK